MPSTSRYVYEKFAVSTATNTYKVLKKKIFKTYIAVNEFISSCFQCIKYNNVLQIMISLWQTKDYYNIERFEKFLFYSTLHGNGEKTTH